MGLLGALGGARPTGVGWLDAVLLGLAGAGIARSAVDARSIPLYLGCVAPAIVQTAAVPRTLGALAMVCVLVRWQPRAGAPVAALAGGLAWAATIGAPSEPAGDPLVVPLLGMAVVVVSGRRGGAASFRRWWNRVAVLALGAAGLGGAVALVAVESARGPVQEGINLLEAGLVAARDGDTVSAAQRLEGAARAFDRGRESVSAPWARAARLVPGVSQNLRALDRILGEVRVLSEEGADAAREADVGTLRARAGRVDLAAIAEMEPPLQRVLAALKRTEAALGDVAEQWLLPMVRNRIDEVHEQVDDALPSARLAVDALRAAPALLGGDEPRRYLVLFTTPVETRATTGFPGNFGELTFENGSFSLTRFGRSSEISDALPSGGGELTGVDEYSRRYGRFGPSREWLNVPLSPDFPTVARVAAQLHAQATGRPVDGVMSVDPAALAALLRLSGPVRVEGAPEAIDAENAARYLYLDQYVQLPDVEQRIAVLERLSRAVMEQLSTADLPGPRDLADLLGPVVRQKHLQMTGFERADAALFDDMGISGRFPEPTNDLVGVTSSNTVGNKIDVFLHRSLDYEVTWDPETGALSATATITLRNDAPADGLPDYVIGNSRGARPLEPALPRGWNGSFVTLYSPWQPIRAALDGAPIDVETSTELGHRAISTFVTVPPGGSTRLVVELEGTLDGSSYGLDLVAQPLVHAEQASVEVRVAGWRRLTASPPLRGDRDRAAGTFALVSDLHLEVAPR